MDDTRLRYSNISTSCASNNNSSSCKIKLCFLFKLFLVFSKITNSFCAVMLFMVISLYIDSAMKMELVLDGATVYEVTSEKLYWLSFLHETTALTSIFIFGMTYDTFVAGCMLQLCAQIEILKYTIGNIPLLRENLQYPAIVKCVDHHNSIFRQIYFTKNSEF